MRASRSNRASRSGSFVNALRQNLDGDVASEPAVVRAVDLAHPAGPEQRVNRVGAKLPTDE